MENPLILLESYDGATEEDQPVNEMDWLGPSYEDVICNPSQPILQSIATETTPLPSEVNLGNADMVVPAGPDNNLPNLGDSVGDMPDPQEVFGWEEFSPRSVSVPDTPQTNTDAGAAGAAVKPPHVPVTDKLAQLQTLQQQAANLQALEDISGYSAQAGVGGHDFSAHPGVFLMPPGVQNINLDMANMPSIPPIPPPAIGNYARRPPVAGKAKRARGTIPKRATKPNIARKPLGAPAGGGGGPSFLQPALAKVNKTSKGKAGNGGPSRLDGTKPAAAYSTEQKRRIRAERNRESAEKSRLRRKQYTSDLEKSVGSLRATNTQLKGRAEALMGTLKSIEVDVATAHAGQAYATEQVNHEGAVPAPALQAALVALERVKTQCPVTFADPATRVEIGPGAGGKRKKQAKK